MRGRVEVDEIKISLNSAKKSGGKRDRPTVVPTALKYLTTPFFYSCEKSPDFDFSISLGLT